jgi:hypothetical protein
LNEVIYLFTDALIGTHDQIPLSTYYLMYVPYSLTKIDLSNSL